MIAVAITLQAAPGRAKDLEALFAEYLPEVSQAPGVVRFEAHRSREDPERYLLHEVYDDYDALTHHRNDELFARWRPRIAELEAGRELHEYDTVAIGVNQGVAK